MGRGPFALPGNSTSPLLERKFMKTLLAIFLLTACAYGELPEEPTPQFNDTSPVAMKLIRSSERRNRTFNKKFIFATAALFGSSIYDAEISHAGIQRGKCVEAFGNPHSSRGELYKRMLPIDGALFGFALLTRKAKIPIAPYSILLGGAGRHIYTGSLWFSEGCF